MKHLSPSTLPSAEQCPCFEPDHTPNATADAGTLYHECMEALAKIPVPKWEEHIAALEVGADTKGLVQESAEQVRGYFGVGLEVVPDLVIETKNGELFDLKPGIYPEAQIETWPGTGKHGYIDLLVVPCKGQVVIIDYKSSRVDHDYTLQLGAYACALVRNCGPFEGVTAQIVAPRLFQAPVYEWSKEDVDAIEKRILAVEEAANSEDKKGHPGNPCTFCAKNGKCPFQAETIKAELPVASGVQETTVRLLVDAQTPDERSQRRKLVTWLEKWIDKVKEDDKTFLEANPTTAIPGFTTVRTQGRKTLDKERTPDIVQKLKSNFGLEDKDIVALCDVNKSKLVEFVGTSGVVEGSPDAFVEKFLDEFTVRGKDIVSLRATTAVAKAIAVSLK